jgi:hypothetical protein
MVSPSLDKPTQADGVVETNTADNAATQEVQPPEELISAPPADEEIVDETLKVDTSQDADAPKVASVPVAQKISTSISASLSSVRETLNKTLFNPDIIKSIGERIPFKNDVGERVETPKKAPVSKKNPATKKQASVSTKELNAGRSISPRPRKSARNSPPKKWYED